MASGIISRRRLLAGAADRLARVFDDFWAPLLKTQFEYNFFPGAAGQVGYEVYLNKRERDGHNLLFGNMGPEMIMYALQKPPYRFPQDYQYFCRLDVDDSVIFEMDSPWSRSGRFGAHQFQEHMSDTLVYAAWFSGGLIYLLDRNQGLDILEYTGHA